MRFPASGPPPRTPSSPRSGWTCPGSRPRRTWPPGPASPPGSASPPAGRRATPAPGTAIATWPASSARRAIGASHTDTFLGERYRRIARRRGKKRAIVAVGRSILVIIWVLLSDDDAHFIDLGPDHYAARTNPQRKVRNHVRELQALGYTVTLNPAA